MAESPNEEVLRRLRDLLAGAGLQVASSAVRQYPEETIFILELPQDTLATALVHGPTLDGLVAGAGIKGFVVIRSSSTTTPVREDQPLPVATGVRDERALKLANLLSERARTSEVQGSLSYVQDASNNLAIATSEHHHLIFGRRGAGKTALMVEAREQVSRRGDATVWLNIQTHRRKDAATAFLWTAREAVMAVLSWLSRSHTEHPYVHNLATKLQTALDDALGSSSAATGAASLVPRLRELVRRFTDTTGAKLFFFVDDLHYLPRTEQPEYLDLLHGSVRDCSSWLKIAAIRHLSRWFETKSSTGLQSGQDADQIDLDVTLQDPAAAKQFLEAVLKNFARVASVPHVSSVFSAEALDRLVVASGAVPRDYVVLCAATIREARHRPNARQAGVQDVNRAAGSAAQTKINELEDDAASNPDVKVGIVDALTRLRAWCVDERRWTFFRVDFRDKEKSAAQYTLLQSLMDLRLVHLVSPGVSDPHRAGHRAEVFTLDLSQFSDRRLRKHLHVLDFERGCLVLKETGTKTQVRRGDNAKRLSAILRGSPVLSLAELSTGPGVPSQESSARIS